MLLSYHHFLRNKQKNPYSLLALSSSAPRVQVAWRAFLNVLTYFSLWAIQMQNAPGGSCKMHCCWPLSEASYEIMDALLENLVFTIFFS